MHDWNDQDDVLLKTNQNKEDSHIFNKIEHLFISTM